MDQVFVRRPHRKSRFGCQECKRRHVKCDEVRPICTGCLDTRRDCVYRSVPFRRPVGSSSAVPLPSSRVIATPAVSTASTDAAGTSISVWRTSEVSVSPSLEASESASSAPTPGPEEAPCPPQLNMLHMELLNHFIFETGPSLDPDVKDLNIQSIMPAVVSSPYLAHQTLALSALHLAHLHPDQAKRYRDEAIALQTQALFLFNNRSTGDIAEVKAETCVPVVIFASFLGLHALAEAVASSQSDADSFVDRFISYINLHRGVNALVSRSWVLLMQSAIFSVLNSTRSRFDPNAPQRGEQATFLAARLYAMLDVAGLAAAPDKACRGAVSCLRPVLQLEEPPTTAATGEHGDQEQQSRAVGIIWSWPILLSEEFTSLLMKRTPEALIILAHYAALLHRRRHTWLVGNAGRMLIHATTKHLGSYWSPWLGWPNEVLLEEA